MTIAYTKEFIRQAQKLGEDTRRRVPQRLAVFADNPSHPILNLEQLEGTLTDCYAIEIIGNVRALYVKRGGQAIFFAVGAFATS